MTTAESVQYHTQMLAKILQDFPTNTRDEFKNERNQEYVDAGRERLAAAIQKHNASIGPRIGSGKTVDECKFHERFINATQILVQENRRNHWCGYVGQVFKSFFESEEQALAWLREFPMADVC